MWVFGIQAAERFRVEGKRKDPKWKENEVAGVGTAILRVHQIVIGGLASFPNRIENFY
jgi:hypothetical protein